MVPLGRGFPPTDHMPVGTGLAPVRCLPTVGPGLVAFLHLRLCLTNSSLDGPVLLGYPNHYPDIPYLLALYPAQPFGMLLAAPSLFLYLSWIVRAVHIQTNPSG